MKEMRRQQDNTVSFAKDSARLDDLTGEKKPRRTLWMFLAARFSWCLSRLLRKRETPFMMLAGEGDAHPEETLSRLVSERWEKS